MRNNNIEQRRSSSNISSLSDIPSIASSERLSSGNILPEDGLLGLHDVLAMGWQELQGDGPAVDNGPVHNINAAPAQAQRNNGQHRQRRFTPEIQPNQGLNAVIRQIRKEQNNANNSFISRIKNIFTTHRLG